MPVGLSITYEATGLTVQFHSNAVLFTPTEWSWDFGDGGSSTQKDPSHTYASSGSYTVNHTASGVSTSKTIEVVGGSKPATTSFTCIKTVPTYHWKAKLLGELCLCSDHTVEWLVEWSGTHPPGYDTTDKGEIFVYPRDDNADEAGVLTVVAVLKKGAETVAVSNEIYLIVTSASYYYTVSQGGGSNNIGGWVRVPDNFGNTGYTGSLGWYGGPDGSIGIPANSSLFMTFDISASELWVYSNDGGSSTYVVNNDGISRSPARGAFSPPWSGGTSIPISGLTSIAFNSDGYGSPWYVFVK